MPTRNGGHFHFHEADWPSSGDLARDLVLASPGDCYSRPAFRRALAPNHLPPRCRRSIAWARPRAILSCTPMVSLPGLHAIMNDSRRKYWPWICLDTDRRGAEDFLISHRFSTV